MRLDYRIRAQNEIKSRDRYIHSRDIQYIHFLRDALDNS